LDSAKGVGRSLTHAGAPESSFGIAKDSLDARLAALFLSVPSSSRDKAKAIANFGFIFGTASSYRTGCPSMSFDPRSLISFLRDMSVSFIRYNILAVVKPAIVNGIAISSRQDVRFHFPG